MRKRPAKSMTLDPRLIALAEAEAAVTGETLSRIISRWALAGAAK